MLVFEATAYKILSLCLTAPQLTVLSAFVYHSRVMESICKSLLLHFAMALSDHFCTPIFSFIRRTNKQTVRTIVNIKKLLLGKHTSSLMVNRCLLTGLVQGLKFKRDVSIWSLDSLLDFYVVWSFLK